MTIKVGDRLPQANLTKASPEGPQPIDTDSYFAGRKKPKLPQDLSSHACINLRFSTSGGLYAWEFEKDGRELKVRVEGQLAFNNGGLCLKAALEGFGLAFVPEDRVTAHLREGRLVSQGAPAEALSEQVMADVFRISAYRAEFQSEAVIVPWADI